MEYARLRRAAHAQLEPAARTAPGLSATNKLLAMVILLATATAILATEPLLTSQHERLFVALEYCFGAVFALEYCARFWAVAEDAGSHSTWRRRLRFIVSPASLVDLLVVLATFTPLIAGNAAPLRLLRLSRILRLAKLGRTSVAMRHLRDAVRSRRHELMLTLTLAATLLVVGATALYAIEGDVQPDKFGSIPRAMWWAVITMTTIGYGDVYPITAAGRVVATIVAIVSIGLIALPTGILAAAFSEAMQRERRYVVDGEGGRMLDANDTER